MKLSTFTFLSPRPSYKLHTPGKHNATIQCSILGSMNYLLIWSSIMGHYMHGFFKVVVVDEDRGSYT